VGLQALKELQAEPQRQHGRDPWQLALLDSDERVGLERATDLLPEPLTECSTGGIDASMELADDPAARVGAILPSPMLE